jgi:putative hydrolase of the HAD superfamily
MNGVRALILDYGEVLSRSQRADSVQAMADALGVDVDALSAAYWQHRRPYDAGQPAPEYWRRVIATLGADGVPPATIIRLMALDAESWTDYRDETWELARAVRAAGGRTAFLSNGVPEVMARIRAERPLASWFDVVVVSSEVRLTKPDPKIYELCLDRLAVEAGQTLFVDDRIENIEAAAKVGLQTLHFVGVDAVSRLRTLLHARGAT